LPRRNVTITTTEGKSPSAAVKDTPLSNPEGLHDLIRAVMQEAFEAGLTNADIEALEHSRDRTPAKPMSFE
jgi:hypothetical protein